MATKATKLPKTKQTNTPTPLNVRKSAAKRSSVSSLKSSRARIASLEAQNSKNLFAGVTVLIAAALISISVGMVSYHKYTSTNSLATQNGKGILFLHSPNTGKLAVGQTIAVAVYEDSGATPVNAVQGDITYPADKLQLVSVQNGDVFSQVAATDTSTVGLVRMARSIQAKTSSVEGAKQVATLQFKVLPISNASGTTVQLGINQATSLLVRTADSQNILRSSGTATYNLE